VGTGSGILSIWAAQAGAAKVFAVEFTDIAHHARRLVESNGLSHIVEVIQSSAEDLVLPCQVDIIISEWMGYILLRESMLDSVIRARNRWMKPGGSMFPSHATMFFGPITYEEDRLVKVNDYKNSMDDWQRFTREMRELYNVNMSCLDAPYAKEQSDYFIYSSLWTELGVEHMVGQPCVIKRLDLNTCTLEDAECVRRVNYSFRAPYPITVSGFAGWFTVDFAGSAGSPVAKRVVLSTGPEVGYTHWGQQVFYLKDAIECTSDTAISGSLELIRQDKNKRLYSLLIDVSVDGSKPNSYRYEIP
jgi:protein arginine N-methyltransferase 1